MVILVYFILIISIVQNAPYVLSPVLVWEKRRRRREKSRILSGTLFPPDSNAGNVFWQRPQDHLVAKIRGKSSASAVREAVGYLTPDNNV